MHCLFQQLTSTCFELAYCSSSGGITLYIQQVVYVMLKIMEFFKINPLNTKLNPICHVLALLGAHLIFHVSGLRVK